MQEGDNLDSAGTKSGSYTRQNLLGILKKKCASASSASGVTAVTFFPGSGAPRRGMVPTAMLPGRTHGLYVVDVGEGECQPVFLTSGQAPDR